MNISFCAFGTENSIEVLDECSENVAVSIKELCMKLDDMFSFFKSDSELSRINAAAGVSPVAVSEETYTLFELALYFSDISDGAFDVTMGPVTGLWKMGKLPSALKLKRAGKLVSYKNIVLGKDDRTVFLQHKGQMADLGGIAKGYASDLIMKLLRGAGINNAIINLGGSIMTLGKRKDGVEFKVGIQNPVKERGEIFGYIRLQDEALVTSGINERYFEKNGKRYHHIISPYTFYPVDNEIMSVTVVGREAVYLDALSTTIFVLGVEKGIGLLKKLDAQGLLVLKNGDIVATEKFADRFSRAEICSSL